MCDPHRGYSGHLDFIIDRYRRNVLEAVVSDLWTFRVTASAEECLSACTGFFQFEIVKNVLVSSFCVI